MMRVGVFRGNFSPITTAQTDAAKQFMKQMWLDLLFVVPKSAYSGPATPIQRLEMCDIAFKDTDGVVVSDMELRHGRAVTLAETLKELSDNDRKLFLLLGSDEMTTLGDEPDADKVFSLCLPVYVRRDDDRSLDAGIIAKVKEYEAKYGKVVRRIITEPMETSSADVRERVRGGHGIGGLVSPAVAHYVRTNGLYKENIQ